MHLTQSPVSLLAFGFSLLSIAAAHRGGHDQHAVHDQVSLDADWATRHMAEEHHISNFDAASFFTLHDYNSDGYWDASEIQRTYGLDDESNRDVPLTKRHEVALEVFKLFDESEDGRITAEEWEEGVEMGKTLPDFGLGRGVHYSYEIEYELNHFEKYHSDDSAFDELTHPEDIEHFRKHDLADEAAERQAQLDRMQIVEANIPQKFRRQRT